MKRNRIALSLLLALLAGLCACGKEQTQAAPTQIPATPAPTEEATPSPKPKENLLAVYQEVLRRMVQEHIGPDGYDYSPREWADNGRVDFAIHDVDGDGAEELILQFADMSIYMYHTNVYGYDAESGELVEEFWGTAPGCQFYDNGAARYDALHQSNGLAGRIWPYDVSKYDEETGKYQVIAAVDAYDLEIMEEVGAQELYPKEIDKEGAGFVYFVSQGDETITMSQSEYDAWYDGIFGGARLIEMDYQPLTVNVENLYYEGGVMPKVDISMLLWSREGEELWWSGLSQRQKELLKDLPADQLPRKAAGGETFWTREEIWEGTLLPLCYDEKNDFTLYAVVAEDCVSDFENGGCWGGGGVVVRLGDETERFSIGHEQFWTGSNPLMVVKDFNGDGSDEAAVALFSGHGTGVSFSTLYIFDLREGWLFHEETVDFSGIDIDVAYDADTKTATLTSGESTVRVALDFPEDWDFTGAYAGNVVRYRYEDGKLLCELGLDFSGGGVGYLATATGEVVYENGRYTLGPLTLEADE